MRLAHRTPLANAIARTAIACVFVFWAPGSRATNLRTAASASTRVAPSARRPAAIAIVPRRVAPPAPPVALQLAGLRVNVPVPHVAVMHAIARDAWPALVRCVTPAPSTRGYVNVRLRANGRVVDVELEGAPLARMPLLTACVRRAIAATVLPPFESDDVAPEVLASFDLLFNLPSLTPPQRRASR